MILHGRTWCADFRVYSSRILANSAPARFAQRNSAEFRCEMPFWRLDEGLLLPNSAAISCWFRLNRLTGHAIRPARVTDLHGGCGMTMNSRRWSAAALLAMGAVGFALGTWNGTGREVAAQSPGGDKVVPAAATPSDYSQRVIAYINGNIPITREDLGEFLIARYGQAKMDLLVNRKIIEHACKQLNVTVTPEEIEAAITDDLGTMNVDKATFVKQFLKQYNKTLYEWKEDVIKPRLLLSKLCMHQVKVEEAEVQRAFEARYGEKVKCRMILWPKGQEKFAYQVYDKIRMSEAEFDQVARTQASSILAAHGGWIDPLGRGAGDDDRVEK